MHCIASQQSTARLGEASAPSRQTGSDIKQARRPDDHASADVPSSFLESAERSSPRKLQIATKGSVESAEDPQQEKLRQEIEEVYRNLEMIMRTEDLKPEERQQLEEEIRRYKQEQEANFRATEHG